jgi:thymidylate synthase
MAQELVNIRPLSKEQFIEKIKTDDEFANKWGELGPVYGAGWRNWGGTFSTQHMNRDGSFGIHLDTLKTNPDSRRIIVNAWNVGELDNMVLPPCHWAFELYTEELTIEERGQLARSKSLCPKWHHFTFDKSGKEIANTLSKTEHYDRHNIPKRRLSLKWHQRSVDLPLGLPFNIASYALLLEILAKDWRY